MPGYPHSKLVCFDYCSLQELKQTSTHGITQWLHIDAEFITASEASRARFPLLQINTLDRMTHLTENECVKAVMGFEHYKVYSSSWDRTAMSEQQASLLL